MKTTRRPTQHIKLTYRRILTETLERHGNMMLAIDIHRVENLILPMEITPERVTTEDINITTEMNT